MSYDLYFKKRNNEKLSREEFNNYFSNRDWYTVENDEAFYASHTGVQFVFNFRDVDPATDSEDPEESFPASFNLNFFRSHVFALEAEPEVASFVKTLDLSVEDPQFEGHEGSTYDRESFLRGWNAGNKVAYVAYGKDRPHLKDLALPASVVEYCWRWNLNRSVLQAQLGEGVFVPQISFQTVNGVMKTCVVWSDAVQTAFPQVDNVLVFRQHILPKSFLGNLLGSDKHDFTIKTFSEIEPLLDSKETMSADGLSYRLLRSQVETESWVKGLPTPEDVPGVEGAAFYSVLDRELFV